MPWRAPKRCCSSPAVPMTAARPNPPMGTLSGWKTAAAWTALRRLAEGSVVEKSVCSQLWPNVLEIGNRLSANIDRDILLKGDSLTASNGSRLLNLSEILPKHLRPYAEHNGEIAALRGRPPKIVVLMARIHRWQPQRRAVIGDCPRLAEVARKDVAFSPLLGGESAEDFSHYPGLVLPSLLIMEGGGDFPDVLKEPARGGCDVGVGPFKRQNGQHHRCDQHPTRNEEGWQRDFQPPQAALLDPSSNRHRAAGEQDRIDGRQIVNLALDDEQEQQDDHIGPAEDTEGFGLFREEKPSQPGQPDRKVK